MEQHALNAMPAVPKCCACQLCAQAAVPTGPYRKSPLSGPDWKVLSAVITLGNQIIDRDVRCEVVTKGRRPSSLTSTKPCPHLLARPCPSPKASQGIVPPAPLEEARFGRCDKETGPLWRAPRAAALGFCAAKKELSPSTPGRCSTLCTRTAARRSMYVDRSRVDEIVEGGRPTAAAIEPDAVAAVSQLALLPRRPLR
jgi:hypothetical protein